MKRLIVILLILSALPMSAQVDRKEVRAGNRAFRKGDAATAELEYRKAVAKDSTSVAGLNNLGVVLSGKGDKQGAAESFGKALKSSATPQDLIRSYFNLGTVAIDTQNWQEAVKDFRNVLLMDPENMVAKERYTYAKKMLQNQQQNQNQDQNQDQNQNQDQDQNQNQDQDQNQDQQKDQNQQDKQDQQNQNQDQDQKQDQPQPRQQISPQQAQQMLQAVQSKEKETQDKVNKEKAALLKSRQKEKNW